jgi:hypothetical protein
VQTKEKINSNVGMEIHLFENAPHRQAIPKRMLIDRAQEATKGRNYWQ